MIELCRVDHRLLHGQVAFSWCNAINADAILIASDSVAEDVIRMSTIRLAKPNGVKLVIKNIRDSISSINSGVTDKYKLLIVTESIEDVYKLAVSCPSIKSVNLGGTKKKDDTKKLGITIYVNKRDRELLEGIIDKGIEVEIRQVPSDKKIIVVKEDLK